MTETLPERVTQFVGRATVAPPTPRQSIIIPTYNERDNIHALLERLAAVLPATSTEIVFVDGKVTLFGPGPASTCSPTHSPALRRGLDGCASSHLRPVGSWPPVCTAYGDHLCYLLLQATSLRISRLKTTLPCAR